MNWFEKSELVLKKQIGLKKIGSLVTFHNNLQYNVAQLLFVIFNDLAGISSISRSTI